MSDSRCCDPPGQRRADTLTATHHHLGSRRDSGASQMKHEHDPEKWVPVFGKDHAPTKRAGGHMRRIAGNATWLAALVISALGCAVGAGLAQPAAPPAVTYVDQGWSAAERDAFYTTSQGSLLIPYAWFKALRRLDVDAPFGGDQLQRYGYLYNEKSK